MFKVIRENINKNDERSFVEYGIYENERAALKFCKIEENKFRAHSPASFASGRVKFYILEDFQVNPPRKKPTNPSNPFKPHPTQMKSPATNKLRENVFIQPKYGRYYPKYAPGDGSGKGFDGPISIPGLPGKSPNKNPIKPRGPISIPGLPQDFQPGDGPGGIFGPRSRRRLKEQKIDFEAEFPENGPVTIVKHHKEKIGRLQRDAEFPENAATIVKHHKEFPRFYVKGKLIPFSKAKKMVEN